MEFQQNIMIQDENRNSVQGGVSKIASSNVESRHLSVRPSFCLPSPNGPLIYEEINPLRLKRSNRSMGAMRLMGSMH